jgi:hypothetical protein
MRWGYSLVSTNIAVWVTYGHRGKLSYVTRICWWVLGNITAHTTYQKPLNGWQDAKPVCMRFRGKRQAHTCWSWVMKQQFRLLREINVGFLTIKNNNLFPCLSLPRKCRVQDLSVGIKWSESASELYRPNDRRLSEKLVPTSADRGCHVVSVTDPYGRTAARTTRRHVFSLHRRTRCP